MPCSDCSSCPVRDLGKVYAAKDPNDPWRRMPRLMDQLHATFGGPMYNRASRTRRDTEARIASYCSRVRAVHGEPCSKQRQAVCATVLRETAAQASARANVYAAWRFGLDQMLQSDLLHAQLKATRAQIAHLDLGPLVREIEHVV